MSMEPPRVLSWEGTLEILDELENGPKDTPERRATIKRARAMRPLVERLRNARKQSPATKG